MLLLPATPSSLVLCPPLPAAATALQGGGGAAPAGHPRFARALSTLTSHTQLQPYYKAEVVMASVALAVLLLHLAWYLLTVRRSRREGRVW